MLKQRWSHLHGTQIPTKARLPSWSLIADIIARTDEVGFLPDFLAKSLTLFPVEWQPPPSGYRVLALYRKGSDPFQKRLEKLLKPLKKIFL